ncbi:ABC transporter ATP-binding protein [Dyadobacter psychrotolerans]|uniref:ABC transporter ATP-binding protein n=1 Tax=Dyadobacter psychrotolerans TaxID=2541721 RepID=A0A4R5DJB3_9BACT|nr:ABC transporter ATP-binding protein [Dyadobacter psychrotolerans]TDE12044.1 ABC transporter ATP-binding protein [Dyadobacter psychrotolerans]
MSKSTSLLATRNLTIGYKSGNTTKVISENLNLTLEAGKMVCLLGPNGAGKSTLMRSLAGLQNVLSGDIRIEGELLSDLKPSDLAKKLSLVLTERIEAGNLTVQEVVTLGRTPYTGWLGNLSNYDRERINLALEATGIPEYKLRRIHQLSDGERQKVMLARALAQDTNIILLDEPTAHLDLPSRVEMMHLLHNLARKSNKAILLSTHELDLALQTADQLWLMKQGGEIATGVPEDLVLNGAFESAFAKKDFYFNRSSGTFSIQESTFPLNISLSGNQDLIFWTKRALEREEIGTLTDAVFRYHIDITETSSGIVWQLKWDENISMVTSLESLANELRVIKNAVTP